MSAAQQLKLLHDLQQIDQQIMEIERFRDSAPQQIAGLEAEIERHRQNVTDCEAQLATCREQRREKERELEKHEAHVVKNKERMMAVKNNEEYHAIQKENDKLKELTEDLEDQILRVMEDIDAAILALKKAKDRFAEVEKKQHEKISDFRKRLEQVADRLAVKIKEREAVLPGVDETFLRRYDRLRETTGGVAVVRVIDRTCQGCRVNVPPQIYNMVIKNEDIITCPQCHRILFYENGAPKEGTVG